VNVHEKPHVSGVGARVGGNLSNLAALLRQQVFVNRNLFARINEPFQPPPLFDTAAERFVLSW